VSVRADLRGVSVRVSALLRDAVKIIQSIIRCQTITEFLEKGNLENLEGDEKITRWISKK